MKIGNIVFQPFFPDCSLSSRNKTRHREQNVFRFVTVNGRILFQMEREFKTDKLMKKMNVSWTREYWFTIKKLPLDDVKFS